MGYAPHTNQDVHYDRLSDVENKRPLILGAVREAEHGHWFEYSERPASDTEFAPDMPHLIYVGSDQHTRYAKVLKTVAYVVVDEDENGEPVIQKWTLRKNNVYATDWVEKPKL